MKSLLTLLHIVFFNGVLLSCLGQGSIELNYSTPLYDFLNDGFCDSENAVLFPGGCFLSESNENRGVLLKILPDGTDQIVYINSGDSVLHFCTGVELPDSNYFFLGYKCSAFEQPLLHSRIVVIITDRNLNTLTTKSYMLPSTYFGLNDKYASIVDNAGNVLVAMGLGENPYGSERHDFGFYKFNPEGDTLMTKTYDTWYDADPYSFKRMNNSNNLMLISHGYLPLTEGELLFIDENLNIIKATRTRPLGFSNYYSEGWLTDTTFLVSDSYTVDGYLHDDYMFRIGRMDTSARYYESLCFDHLDTVEYIADHYGMAYLNDTTIYVCGFQAYNSFIYDKPIKIYLYLIDKDLNIKGSKVLGNDHYYWGNGVIATKDGGCMVWALKFEIPYNNQLCDSHIWKVMPEDMTLYTRITNLPQEKLTARVWPNPATNKLYVSLDGLNTGDDFRFRIFDSGGRKCYDTRFTSTGNCLEADLHNLPSGIYLYEIAPLNGEKSSGKFIKN